jgi:predicted DCC family thiol-disulfide oxidoreductase YuxK
VRTVIWDSECSFCRRSVQIARYLDWFRIHEYVGSAEPGAFDDPRVTPEMADRAVQLLTPTRRAEGFDAIRRILALCPLTFWLAPLLWIPPVYRLGDRTYQRVALRRSCKI